MANKITGSITTDSIVIGRIGNSGKVKGGTDRAEIELIPEYEGPYEVTPDRQEHVLETDGLKMADDVVVHAIPSEYIIPAGTAIITQNGITNITPYEYADVNVPIPPGYIIPAGSQTVTENGEYDVTSLAEMVVDVNEYVEPVLQSKTRTYIPIDAGSVTEVITADENYDGLDQVTVTVEAIPTEQKTVTPSATAQVVTPSAGKYLTSVTVEAMPSQRLQAKEYIVDHAGTETITADSGYDGLSEVEVDVPSANYLTGVYYEYYTDNNVRKWHFRGMTELDTGEGDVEGWLGEGTNYGEYVVRNVIPTGTSVTPTESSQTVGGANYMMEGAVTVNAISSNYVGSGITRRSSSDLTASGATVTVPSGYYSAQATKSVASGTAGTPAATKGTVSNHSISVTPSVTNTSGYITGSTINGTAVTVSASELVSGSQTVTSNQTVDVTNLAELVVNVPSKNTQVVQGTTRTNASTLTAIGSELTVSKTGTYDIYYSCFRTNTSSSYTWATRLYINGTAYGTAENTTWTNNQQNTHLSNISLTAGDKLSVYGRNTRGTSYYVCAPTLAIVEA